MPDHNELPHTFKIYIPTECVCGELLPEIERNEVLDEVKTTLSGWFGGATTSRVEGSWEHTDGRLAKEPVDVVTSYATREAAEEHHEEFTELVADLANRLTQDAVLCEVNAKGNVYSATALPEPHRCMGGGTRGSLPVPRQASEKQRQFQLEAALQQLTDVRDARDLFCNVLHYEFEDEQLATANWPDKLRECLALGTSPQIIADQNGFKILYLQLAEDYLRKGSERELIQRIIKDDPTLRGLVVVSDVDQKQWNLVNAKFEKEEGKRERLRLRRMRVGPGQSVRTAVERLSMVDIETAGDDTSAAELQDLHDRAFDVESVSKEFFNEISNWYFWALSEVKFPTDTLKDGDDDEKLRATSLIRFLTRIIFCWFLKEKRLIPESLFREKFLADILKNLDDDSCTYHQGILQNLFFATLNQRMGKDSKGQPYRAFAKDEGFPKNKSTHGVDTLYRYEEHFREPDKALSHFADVPFLNGGLFECLDRTDEDSGKKLYVDGFSRNKKKRARVPNHLFFAGEQTVDLSEAYGDTGRRNARVRGLLRILHAYNFTVEENTPIDEEIALDPELLGKVFENLLASYNEETKTTARKQTGSFYTPRPIVEYMVDESLKTHLCGTLTKLGREEEEAREQLDLLLGYTEEEPSFSEKEIDALLKAIHTCKILDPACGSGAFPIGMLQKLVHVVHKLDPDNDVFEAVLLREAGKIEDRDERRKKIEQIGKDFLENDVDYVRKLYLIEYCLYGVDIQPIAIQISKLRFFISLICDQRTNRDKAKNHGIRALPNLETKFVAANTLIGLQKKIQTEIFDSPKIEKIEEELQRVRHEHFSVQRRRAKLALQDKDRKLRQQLKTELNQSTFADQNVSHKLASWNPYDANSSASFFEPLWMFDCSLSEGFDIAIGNPPYVGRQAMKQQQPEVFAHAKQNYQSAQGRDFDLFALFIEQSTRLLRPGGCLCLIVPTGWYTGSGFSALRRYILTATDPKIFVNLPYDMFEQAWVDTTVFQTVRRHKETSFPRTDQCIANIKSFARREKVDKADAFSANVTAVNLTDWQSIADDAFLTRSTPLALKILSNLKRRSIPLSQVADIQRGVTPFKLSESASHKNSLPAFSGVLRRYSLTEGDTRFIRYDNTLAEFKPARYFAGPRVLLRELISRQMRLQAYLATDDFVTNKSMQSLLPLPEGPDIKLILAVVNSRLISWQFLQRSNVGHRDDFPKIVLKETRELPFPRPERLASEDGKKIVKSIVASIDKILEKRSRDITADISSIDESIDEKVYALFELESEEIELVNGEL